MFYYSGMTISLSKHVPEVSADTVRLFWEKFAFPIICLDLNFSFPIFSHVSDFRGQKFHFSNMCLLFLLLTTFDYSWMISDLSENSLSKHFPEVSADNAWPSLLLLLVNVVPEVA